MLVLLLQIRYKKYVLEESWESPLKCCWVWTIGGVIYGNSWLAETRPAIAEAAGMICWDTQSHQLLLFSHFLEEKITKDTTCYSHLMRYAVNCVDFPRTGRLIIAAIVGRIQIIAIRCGGSVLIFIHRFSNLRIWMFFGRPHLIVSMRCGAHTCIRWAIVWLTRRTVLWQIYLLRCSQARCCRSKNKKRSYFMEFKKVDTNLFAELGRILTILRSMYVAGLFANRSV